MEFNKDKALKIEYVYYKNQRTIIYTFKCILEDCNNIIKIQNNRKHSGKCRSCTQKKKPYEYILSELYQRYKIKRGMNVTLTYEELIDFINNPFCHYCNSEVEYFKYTRAKNGEHTKRAYHLDRKDNNEGYTKDNLVVCCWECNRLKSNRFTYEEFIQLSPILKKIMKERNK